MNIVHRMRDAIEYRDRPEFFVLTRWDYEDFLKSSANMKLDLVGCTCAGMTCEALRFVPVVCGTFRESFTLESDFNQHHYPIIRYI